MEYYKITFEDEDFLITGFNGNIEEAKNYYHNKYFNLGIVKDNMKKCIAVEEV